MPVSRLFVGAVKVILPWSFSQIAEAWIVGGDATAEASLGIGVGWRSTGYMAS